MKKLIIFILIISILLFSKSIQAQDSIHLNNGQIAPFEGYLLPPEKITEFRNDSIDLDFYKKTNINLGIEIQDYNTRLLNYQTENQNLNKQLSESNNSFWSKAGFFILGCAVTGLLAQAIYRTR